MSVVFRYTTAIGGRGRRGASAPYELKFQVSNSMSGLYTTYLFICPQHVRSCWIKLSIIKTHPNTLRAQWYNGNVYIHEFWLVSPHHTEKMRVQRA